MYLASFMPVLAAGLVPLIVGAIWYHPRVFGLVWMNQKHITPEMAERASRQSLPTSLVQAVFGVLVAWMLGYILDALPIITFVHAIAIAALVWLCLIVPTTIHRVLWDHITPQLYAIEYGQWLVSFCFMAVILVM